jgi:hypothetical protein
MEDLQGIKVYICGPITGVADYKRRFARADRFLRSRGAITLKPSVLPLGFTHAEYLYICFAMIDVCDVLVLLDGWTASEGCLRELEYAKKRGKRFLYYEFLREGDVNE